MSNPRGDWIIRTHLGFERRHTEEQAEQRADALRRFFGDRPEIRVEAPEDAS